MNSTVNGICTYCEGSGRIVVRGTCRYCDGRGEMDSPATNCISCYKKSRPDPVCPLCQGTGIVKGRRSSCANCSGAGHIEKRKACQHCGGTGKAGQAQMKQYYERTELDYKAKRFQDLLWHNPADRELRLKLAEILTTLGKSNEAFEEFKILATAALDSSDPEQARLAMQKMIKLKPDDVETCLQYARIVEGQGDLDEAIEAYQHCLVICRRHNREDAVKLIKTHLERILAGRNL